MKKLTQIQDEKLKTVNIFQGSDENWALANGFSLMEVEEGYNGNYYIQDFAPTPPEPTYTEQRIKEYPDLADQLDTIYWDKINGTNKWNEMITDIKSKYPKK